MRAQAASDTVYFLQASGRAPEGAEAERVGQALLGAYRWQYIASGVRQPHFSRVIASMLNDQQAQRITSVPAPLTP